MAQPQLPPTATYPAREIAGIVEFLHNVTAAFDSDPVVRDEFFALVTGFGAGPGSDAGAVVARAAEILADRPALLAQFRGCLAQPPPPDQGLAAPRRPRRSNRSRPAEDGDVWEDDAFFDDEHENRLRRRREREQARRAAKRAAAAAAAGVDVEEVEVDEEERLRRKREREQARRAAKRAAAGVEEVDEEEEERLRRKREREQARRAAKRAAAAASAGEEEDAAEDPRLAAATAFVNRVKRVAGEEVQWRFLKVVYDARADRAMDAAAVYDGVREALGPAHGDLLRRFAALFLPGEAEWAEQQQEEARRQERKRRRDSAAGDDGDDALPTAAKTKKPRAGDVSEASARVHDGGAGSSSAAAPVDRFRALWEFETGYSVLVATMARTEELIELHPHDDDDDGEGAFTLDLEKLFPGRDSRAFLERMYGVQWEAMREGLEHRGLAGRALRVVLDSLRWAEERAVEDAREWRDKARAAEGLHELLNDRVEQERRRRTSRHMTNMNGACPSSIVEIAT